MIPCIYLIITCLARFRYLGVTPPISASESSEREKVVTASLMDELRRQNTIESEEETRTRYFLLCQWHILWFLRHPGFCLCGLSVTP